MTNQIKHNSPKGVLSQFNPIASLKPKTRKLVNENFIRPMLSSFFLVRGGIENFEELDPDKIQTEIEFERNENFVKSYIYKEIIDEISKYGEKVIFKPKYVISFDTDLTDYNEENNLKYGVIRLGDAPILYYIYIDLQELIRFIKSCPEEPREAEEEVKFFQTDEEKRNKLFESLILNKKRQLNQVPEAAKTEIFQEINRLETAKKGLLQGQGGKLRINLAWHTTDDLDLHVITPNGEIAYSTPNKTIEHNGVLGVLDIDSNAGGELTSNPQENVNFNAAPFGKHSIYVQLFKARESNEVPFTVTIIPENGEGRLYNKVVNGKGNSTNVVGFEYKDGDLVFDEVA